MTTNSNNDDFFNASRAEVFEALGHPTRIRILQVLAAKPLAFAELKRTAGIESNGLLTFHLGKLSGLVRLNADGAYALTDEGREALRTIEVSRSQREGEKSRSRFANSTSRSKVVIASLAIVLVLLASISVVEYGQIQGLNSRDSMTSTSTVTQTSTVDIVLPNQGLGLSSVNSSLGLEFILTLNTTTLRTGQIISIAASIYNTLGRINNVTAASDWALASLEDWATASVSCPSYASVQIFQGHYTQSNVSSATPLRLSLEGLATMCFNLERSYYPFLPSSNEATFLVSSPPPTYVTLPMGAAAAVSGYYVSGQSNNSTQQTDGLSHVTFAPGVYTVTAGDEWGQLLISNFMVQ